jgi:hypothetical protein
MTSLSFAHLRIAYFLPQESYQVQNSCLTGFFSSSTLNTSSQCVDSISDKNSAILWRILYVISHVSLDVFNILILLQCLIVESMHLHVGVLEFNLHGVSSASWICRLRYHINTHSVEHFS